MRCACTCSPLFGVDMRGSTRVWSCSSDSSSPVAAASPAALTGLLSGACVAWPTPPMKCRVLCHCRPDEFRSQRASSQPAQEGPAVVLQAASWRVHVARSPGLHANSWQQLTSPWEWGISHQTHRSSYDCSASWPQAGPPTQPSLAPSHRKQVREQRGTSMVGNLPGREQKLMMWACEGEVTTQKPKTWKEQQRLQRGP